MVSSEGQSFVANNQDRRASHAHLGLTNAHTASDSYSYHIDRFCESKKRLKPLPVVSGRPQLTSVLYQIEA